MTQEPSRHVAFVYVGPLGTRGRLLKQVATLQKEGVHCEVFHGNSRNEKIGPETYPFPVTSMPFNSDGGQLRSFSEVFRFARKAGPLIAESDADTVVCVSLIALVAGIRAKKIRPSLRLIFDNNELHLESYLSRVKRIVWRPLHNRYIRSCDVIIHAEPNRMAYFKEHYPLTGTPQLVIENFPSYVPGIRKPERNEGPVRVIYLGGFGAGRFTEEIIDAFSSFDDSVSLDIVGSGFKGYGDRLAKRIEEGGSSLVRILPPVPYAEIPELLRSYDIGIALYRNTNLNNYYCAPNKVYDYLMNGMPVIANDYPGLVSVLEENKVGACISDVGAAEIRSAIDRIVDERRAGNITDELRKKYCWEAQEKRYLEIFGY
ncbi:MAG: glycosyltransferase [Verrucomicrobiota bacterium]